MRRKATDNTQVDDWTGTGLPTTHGVEEWSVGRLWSPKCRPRYRRGIHCKRIPPFVQADGAAEVSVAGVGVHCFTVERSSWVLSVNIRNSGDAGGSI